MCGGANSRTRNVLPNTKPYLTALKGNRDKWADARTGMLMAGMVIGTAGSLGRFDYNIALFAFELIRDRYFNTGYLGNDLKVYDPAWNDANVTQANFAGKRPLWSLKWNDVTAKPYYNEVLRRQERHSSLSLGL